MQKINRVGETNINTNGSLMTIIEYNNANDIVVEFKDGYKIKTFYSKFKDGEIRYPYDKTVFKVGYIGIGNYKTKIKKEQTIQYKYWFSMLQRCYDEKYKISRSTYEDKYVCEEWHNFQNFAKWFDENYYEVDGQKMQLDKDILFKGNKVYSPDTCVFVPQRINTLFTKSDKARGEYPIGVSYKNETNRYRANYSMYDKQTNKKKQKHIGYYNTPEEAFYKYKEFKENYIKEVANEYKDKIPQKLYEAMYNYVVEIDD